MTGAPAGLHPEAVFAMQQDKPKGRLKTVSDAKQIRHMRQNLLWPVHLLPLPEGASRILLQDDGATHRVQIILGSGIRVH